MRSILKHVGRLCLFAAFILGIAYYFLVDRLDGWPLLIFFGAAFVMGAWLWKSGRRVGAINTPALFGLLVSHASLYLWLASEFIRMVNGEIPPPTELGYSWVRVMEMVVTNRWC